MGSTAGAPVGAALAGYRMKILLILNDPPCGTERSYNGLRPAGAPAPGGKIRAVSTVR